MRLPRIILPILFVLLAFRIFAQGTWDIKDPGPQFTSKCGTCVSALRTKPKEVQFGLFADADNAVWFVITDQRFFDQLIRKSGDGFAVDVVTRDQYSCDGKTQGPDVFPKGTLLKPLYQAELKRTKVITPNGQTVMQLGTLPDHIAKKEHELNLVILQDRNICHYNYFYNLQTYRWDLLNMGMYMDTLTYSSSADTLRNDRVASLVRRKQLHFTIPFEKNKSEYSPRDLQPLYDSLRLTDFTIKRIDINAYSSVEGPGSRNIELQQKRAQSIVDAMQSFQSPSIVTNVKASENWVEFLSDVTSTPYAELALLDKAEVKRRLTDKQTADALEPTLAGHRKALIVLELQRKDGMEGMKEEQIIKAFEEAIATKNVAYAQQLQNTVYARILDDELPTNFIDRMEVPAQRDFAGLLNSRQAFKYFQDPSDAFQCYLALQELDRLMPNDGHIKYNLCVLQFHLLIMGGQTIEPLDLKRNIESLRGHGIETPLVTRMLINLNIIMAELDMMKGDYAKKDERIAYIRRNYSSVPMQDQDHLSLAQYFASYANYAFALDVIEPHLADIDVDEDLLFYFLNLTIFDPEKTKKSAYRSTMLNAANKNKLRFCALFDAFSKGGITFQLLDDPNLTKTFCETCR